MKESENNSSKDLKQRIFEQLSENKDCLRLIDYVKLQRYKQKIISTQRRRQPIDKMLLRLQKSIKLGVNKSLVEVADNLTKNIEYPENLPVSNRHEEISQLITDNQVIIICGATGSGKTTQLPKIALNALRGRRGYIGCTQPRRLAANSVCSRVASELKVSVGSEVGYKVRFDNNCNDKTVVKFMTDGVLLAESISDNKLLQYDTLIIDEAHERSLNIDFILGYLKLLLVERPDLKIIISSATLDAENFSQFFNNAPIVEVEGRTYDVEQFFMPANEDEELSNHVYRAVRFINDIDNEGDILIFLPGEREIREVAEHLTGRLIKNSSEILPLFARMGMAEQQRIFSTNNRCRRIILATNVAETSLTIPGIHYVIDSGLVRMSRYNPRTSIQELKIEQVSQASAKQRMGRCGRIAEGVCVFLYDEEKYDDSSEFTDPEIRRTSLAGVILQMAVLKLPSLEEFPLLDAPENSLIRDGYKLLKTLAALDDDCHLTEEGERIAKFNIDVHIAAMISCSEKVGCISEVLVLSSFLSIQDVRERPIDKQQQADSAHNQWLDQKSDFLTILNLWNFIRQAESETQNNRLSWGKLRKICKTNFLNFNRMREWQNLWNELVQTVKDLKWNLPKNYNREIADINYDLVHKSLLSGLPTNIGKYDFENSCYSGVKNRKYHIFPGSGLYRSNYNKKDVPQTPEWICSFALVETSRLFARTVAEIKPEWLEELFPKLCRKHYRNAYWSEKKGFVFALETVNFGALKIVDGRRIHYGNINCVEAREIFIRDGLVLGNIFTNSMWLKIHRKMLTNIEVLETKIRRPAGLLDTEAIYDHFNEIIPHDVNCKKSLEKWLNRSKEKIAMQWTDAVIEQVEPIDFSQYPNSIELNNHKFKLHYNFDPGENNDGISIYGTTEQISLLPPYFVEWNIEPYRLEKVSLLIKSLPKQYRRLCNPVHRTADDFCELAHTGAIDVEQPLMNALADFLHDYCQCRVQPRDFNSERLPHYLTVNIGILNGEGQIINMIHGYPQGITYKSVISLKNVKIKNNSSGNNNNKANNNSTNVNNEEYYLDAGVFSEWNENLSLPETVYLADKDINAHVCLSCVNDSDDEVEVKLLKDYDESYYDHRSALMRLFKNLHQQQLKNYRKKLPISKNSELALYHVDPMKCYVDDVIDESIIESVTNNGEVEIMDYKKWDERQQIGLGNLFGVLTENCNFLASIIGMKEDIDDMFMPLYENSLYDSSTNDILEHLEFLFRYNFVTANELYCEYPRYLKGLILRLERVKNYAGKDEDKMAKSNVEYYAERLKLALEATGSFEHNFALRRFAFLLEEYRIATFAPEIGLREKVSQKKLDQQWDAVRL